MFTGIVERQGRITQFERGLDCVTLVIETGYPDLETGESVAVNGACLTVTEATPKGETLFFPSPERIFLTNLGRLEVGGIANLERALPAGARLSGHVVQGHVDGVGRFVRALPGD